MEKALLILESMISCVPEGSFKNLLVTVLEALDAAEEKINSLDAQLKTMQDNFHMACRDKDIKNMELLGMKTEVGNLMAQLEMTENIRESNLRFDLKVLWADIKLEDRDLFVKIMTQGINIPERLAQDIFDRDAGDRQIGKNEWLIVAYDMPIDEIEALRLLIKGRTEVVLTSNGNIKEIKS